MENSKPLILLHGALGAAKQFDALANKLKEKFDLFIPELPQHGKNKKAIKDFSIPAFAEYLKAYIKSEELLKPAIFGFSMGGYIALALESKEATFSNIITLGTKMRWSQEIAVKETKKLSPTLIEAKVPKFASHLKSRHGSTWKTLCRDTAALMHKLGKDWRLKESDFGHISIPVKILRGEKDNMVDEEESLWASSNIAQGRFKSLAETGHPLERVEAELLAVEILHL